MLLTIAVVIFGGIYVARAVKSAEGYSLGGRSASFPLVAGSIAGTVIGGGATVGTAQMASTVGLSAWWFTLSSGITFIVMGFLYARPLRKTGLETISQYLVLNYGKTAGSIASWVTTIGIFFSVVSSCLPGIGIICAVFDVSVWTAALLLMLLVASYVFFGGMKSAGVGGILKMLILFASLFVAGGTAFWSIHTDPAISAALPDFPWFSLLGNGTGNAAANLLSVFVGIICTQTYIQALFSAIDPQTAAYGAFAAALAAGVPGNFFDALADLSLVDITGTAFLSPGSVAANLVYAAHSDVISDVMIDGKWVMRGRQIPGEAEIMDGARSVLNQITL